MSADSAPRARPVRQLALDLGHRPALGHDDFLVAPCNRDAVAWLDRWPDWPMGGLAIHGPAASGKSHLVAVWRARTGAAALTPSDLDAASLDDRLKGGAVALDDAEPGIVGHAARERALLRLYNGLRESGGTLLIAAETPPARWAVALADLRSRLAALPAAAVGAPDDALIAAVLVKLFADRQLKVGGEAIEFLVARMERSFAAARRLVAAIDAEALASRRPVTVPLVRKVVAAASDPRDG